MTIRRALPLLLLTIIALMLLVYHPSGAADDNRVALVVDFGNGQVAERCVSFSEETITGYEALERAGLPVETDFQTGGAAVCRIDGQGCPSNDCFCACRGGGDCVYWSYWHLNAGEWNYSAGGSGIYQLSDGDVDGWVWGLGSVTEAPPPPLVSFNDVCAVAPTDTPTATLTPSRTSTPVILPTAAPTDSGASSPATQTVAPTPQGTAPILTVSPTLAPAQTAASSPPAGATTASSLAATPTLRPTVQGDEAASTPAIIPQLPLPTIGAIEDAPPAAPTAAELEVTSAPVAPAVESAGGPTAPPATMTEPNAGPLVAAEAIADAAVLEGVTATPASAVVVIGAVEPSEEVTDAVASAAEPALDPTPYAGYVGLLLLLGALALLVYRRRGRGGVG